MHLQCSEGIEVIQNQDFSIMTRHNIFWLFALINENWLIENSTSIKSAKLSWIDRLRIVLKRSFSSVFLIFTQSRHSEMICRIGTNQGPTFSNLKANNEVWTSIQTPKISSSQKGTTQRNKVAGTWCLFQKARDWASRIWKVRYRFEKTTFV